MEFAPISSKPSTRLRAVAGYFTAYGASMLVFGLVGLVLRITGASAAVSILTPVLALKGLGVVFAGSGLLWTGRTLHAKLRKGLWGALFTLFEPSLGMLVSSRL